MGEGRGGKEDGVSTCLLCARCIYFTNLVGDHILTCLWWHSYTSISVARIIYFCSYCLLQTEMSFLLQASNAYSMVEQNVFVLYERNGKQLQDKLQELFATLDRIAKLELELDQFRVSLGALYKEIH